MIRDSIVADILSALDYDIFRIEDFEVVKVAEKDFEEISIQYNEWYYNIVFDLKNHSCLAEYSPGCLYVKEKDQFLISTFQEKLKESILRWENSVKQELFNPLQQRFIFEQLEQFKEKLDNKLNEVDDSYFSKEEGEELKQRLEELKENFIKANKETEEELNKLRAEIDFLKTTVDTLSKKKWLRNAATKIWAWGQKKENQELIKTSAKAIKAISQIDISEIE